MICDNYKEKIKSIIVKTLYIDIDAINVTNNTLISEDLGADSLDGVELIMEFEKEFDITISDELAENFLSKKPTVGDAIKFIEVKTGESTLSSKQKFIKNQIEKGKVKFLEVNYG